VALGFVFAMGGLGLQLTGWLAEPHRLGLYSAMLLLCIVPVVTAALVVFLPASDTREETTPVVQPAGVAVAKR
jgi:hypothetical protein